MALDPTASTSASPAMGADSDTDSGMGAGYVIEITVTADGMISVGVESADEESQEEDGEGASSGGSSDSEDESADPSAEPAEPADGAAMPAKTIKEALTMALEIFKNNGQSPSADTSDSDFSSGYSGQ